MKKRNWLVFFPLLLLVVGCNSTPTPRAEPALASSVLATPEVLPTETGKTVSAEGIVVPAQKSTLSFLLAGNITEIVVSEGDQVQAGENLITLHTPELDSALLQSEASLRAAIADLQYWMVARKHKPPERRWLAEDRVDAAKAAIETAFANQAIKNLSAPYNATIITVSVMPGEFVNAHQSVILLADLENLKIETTDLSERDVVKISVGQRALVYIEALNMEIEGEVIAISPLASDNSGDVVYTITIEMNEIPASLRWGMSVKINFDAN